MFQIVLVRPEIAPNTGNVIRLAANTGSSLHLVRPLGFTLDDARMRRAGLDYHEFAPLQVHDSWAALREAARAAGGTMWAFTTRGSRWAQQAVLRPGDWLVFGAESSGLPDEVLQDFEPAQRLRLPMRPGQRSLNLSNAVAVATFEAWRQNDWQGAV
ncbi:MAG: tRNA (cytidine(34)-2'-O)-methyltransferase [Betaproteobacteria bacterium]|nr:tRNA (cytidine(34)-2'-O)-methyltransferase [Betaproteobacteria bacterium]